MDRGIGNIKVKAKKLKRELSTHPNSDINDYAKWTSTVWHRGNGALDEKDLIVMSIGLAEECGEVMGLLKRRWRDANLDRDALIKELGDVAFYWAQLCNFFMVDPSDVLKKNMDKVIDRRERGVIHGSGDDR